MQRIRKVFAKVVAGLLVVSNLAIVAPSMTYAASASGFTTYGGWNEMMYATIKGVKDADVTVYHIQVQLLVLLQERTLSILSEIQLTEQELM